MARAFLGLGTNVGARGANLHRALEMLSAAPGVTVERRSSVYETAPVGAQDQRNFLNMVVQVETDRSPRDLLKLAKFIEQQMGRKPGVRWGPRVIDVDVLLCGDATVQEPDLSVPHPQMWNRAFVMVPLAEIAADLVGRCGETVSDLAGRAQGEVRLWDGGE